MVASLLKPEMGQGSTRSNGNWASPKVQEVLQTREVVEFMRSSCLSRDADSNGGAGCVTGLLNGRRLWLFNGAIVPPRIASSVSVKLDVAAKAAVGTSAFLPARDNDTGFAFTTGAGEARVILGQHPTQNVPEPPEKTFGGGIFTFMH